MTGDWWMLGSLWLATAVIVVVGGAPYLDASVAHWSLRFDVVVDRESQAWVRSRLRRARSIRWCAFALGLNISALPTYMNVIDVERAASFSNPATSSAPWLAAAAGAVLAELLVVQRASGERLAEVRQRRWRDYIAGGWILVVAACGPVAVAGALSATAQQTWRWQWSWVGPISAGFALLATTVGVRSIVNRPMLAVAGQHRLLDDALRADGVHHVVGASVALAGTGACTSLGLAAGDRWWWGFLCGAGVWVFLGCWHGLARRERWNVARVRLERA